mmetsp:Transcript_3515/g.10096  ORF Transcript_3515/g.10096 Transcript_3515/m.10096 type:complete len:269 (-) Transcript_3515:166-972(-)
MLSTPRPLNAPRGARALHAVVHAPQLMCPAACSMSTVRDGMLDTGMRDGSTPVTSARLAPPSTRDALLRLLGSRPAAAAAAAAALSAFISAFVLEGDATIERMGTPSASPMLADGIPPHGRTRATCWPAPRDCMPRGTATAPREEFVTTLALARGGLVTMPPEPPSEEGIDAPVNTFPPAPPLGAADEGVEPGSPPSPHAPPPRLPETRSTGAPSAPVFETTGSLSSSSSSSGDPFLERCRRFWNQICTCRGVTLSSRPSCSRRESTG